VKDVQQLLIKDDERGIARVTAKTLPRNNLHDAAKSLWKLRGSTVLIATGFIVHNKPETDGPPGALAVARALAALNYRPVLISQKEILRLLDIVRDFNVELAEFPVQSRERSTAHALRLLRRFDPAAIIGIELCGPNKYGCYRDMRGRDISEVTARMDSLFSLARKQSRFTVGIGDGGNEIGFGNVSPSILRKLGIEPCISRTSKLIVASISNWGAYGLVHELSKFGNVNLLPTPSTERKIIQRLVANGAVDGFTGRSIPKVDGRSLAKHEMILKQLRKLR
jgi:hypothetical protein